ncbi:hypothetical protein [Streptomyces qinglanensis]|uniref:hypothetical protein n=1 Tax=Streptomyces qinglanensis TaxID=943816 RepID=UPI0037A275BA
MTQRSCEERPPPGFVIEFATPEPELNPDAAAVLLRILKKRAERTGSLTSGELSLDDPKNYQKKDHTGA